MIILPESDADLLAECDVSTFRSSGKGGQNVNKVETAVRIHHRPTGLVLVSREERSQYRNKVICLRKLRALVSRMNRVRPKRVQTAVPRRSRAERLEEKSRRSEKKQLRSRPSAGDGD